MFSFIENVSAQIEASSAAVPPFDPVGLIEDEFLGEGIDIVNITFEGNDGSVGYFNSGSSSIGIEKGIIMTTGLVEANGADVGINAPGSAQSNADNGSTANDADLTSLSSVGLFNIARYTIEFIPSSDTLSFRYVFASEEYPEFVCSDYNDLFGFFISGPGISGTFQNGGVNIATIPGTSLPVTINNVNGGAVGSQGTAANCTGANGSLNFSSLFIDNDGSGDFPVFDGWLTPFEAKVKVEPCQTYTIKIVIADQGDPQFDSGVFLQAKSFGSETIDVQLVTESVDGTVIEGCTDATVRLDLKTPRGNDTNIDLMFSGTAINGTDFQNINSTITIPAGQTTYELNINAIEDNVPEGTEELQIALQVNACRIDTFNLYFNDYQLPAPVLEDSTVCAPGATIDLDGDLGVTAPPPTTISANRKNVSVLSPTPGGTPTSVVSNLEVTGIQPLQLGPDIIQSVCLDIDHNRSEDLRIYLRAPGGQLIPLSTDNGGTAANYSGTCFRPDATNAITNGTAPFTGDWLPEGDFSDLWIGDSPLNGTWELEVIDDQFGFNGIITDWSITFNPSFSLEYAWTPAAGLSCADCPNPTATVNATETYTLVVTDAFGCTTSDEVTLAISGNDFADAGMDQTICAGETADLVASGGVSYEWDTNDRTAGIQVTPTTNTTYSVTVTNAAGCESIDEVTVSISPSIDLTLDKSDIKCFGENNGTVTANASGGTTPYSYEWSNNETTSMISGLAANTYEVTVTDAADCEAIMSTTIVEPAVLILAKDSVETCANVQEGSATVSVVSGGTAPFRYQWDAVAGGQTNATATNLAGGTYQVTVFDANDCEMSTSVMVNSVPVVNMPTPSCGTVTNDAITFVWSDDVNATGFEVNINNGGWIAPNGTDNLSHTVSGLSLGETVTIEVRGLGNCAGTIGTIDCKTLDCTSIDVTPTTRDVTCFGENDGSVSVTAMGDNPPFTFTVNGDSNSDGQFSNMTAGSYVVTVEDAIGCTGSANFEIREPTELMLTLIADDISCFGANDGSITTSVSGGMMPYEYEWNNSETTPMISGLTAREYIVTLTDAADCEVIDRVTILEPEVIILQKDSSETCANVQEGSATVAVVSGGTAPFRYQWDAAAGGQTNATATNLAGGTYQVTVFDANDCEMSTSVMVDAVPVLNMPTPSCGMIAMNEITFVWSDDVNAMGFEININDNNWIAPNGVDGLSHTVTGLTLGETVSIEVRGIGGCNAPIGTTVCTALDCTTIDVVPTANDASCFGQNDGSVSITATGDNPPFTYTVNGNSNSDGRFSNLPAGTYVVTVEDAIGCTGSANFEIREPAELTATGVVITQPNCDNLGQATVTVNGGTGSYRFDWSSGSQDSIATDLNGGVVDVLVTDGAGCTTTASVTINAYTPISLTTTATDTDCSGTPTGTVEVFATGGQPPLTYQWDDPDMTNTPRVERLSANTYTITVRDGAGCSQTATAVVGVPAQFVIDSLVGRPVLCAGEPTGRAAVYVSGGSGVINYTWSNGVQTNENNGIPAGTYEVIIEDAAGCKETQSVEITEPNPIDITLAPDDLRCFDSVDGTIAATVSGGVSGYDYSWNTGATTSDLTDLTAGTYTLEVTDQNGCTETETAELIAPAELNTSLDVTPITCLEPTATVFVNVEGGTPTYQYDWNLPGLTGSDINNLEAGSYSVIISDANGCNKIEEVVIDPAPVLEVEAETIDPVCVDDLGSLIITPLGGVPPYEIEFENSGDVFQNQLTFTDLESGNYSVLVTDADGCDTKFDALIENNAQSFNIDLGVSTEIGIGDSTTIRPTIINGSGNLTYTWTSDSNSGLISCTDCREPTITPYFSTNYHLTVTDQNGCTARSSVFIIVNRERQVFIPSAFSPNSDGTNDQFTVFAKAGTMIDELAIFDRWGNQLFTKTDFEPNDVSLGWDGNYNGKPMNTGVFVFYAKLSFPDGETEIYKGDVSLFR